MSAREVYADSTTAGVLTAGIRLFMTKSGATETLSVVVNAYGASLLI